MPLSNACSTYLNTLIVVLSLTAITSISHAAGTPAEEDYGSELQGQTWEERAEDAFQAGLRHRDRGLRFESEAEKANNDSLRHEMNEKAQQAFRSAVEEQGDALRMQPQHYEAANELGFALRKQGKFRKAIGAYNYALGINADFHAAAEYRGQAYLALGMFEQSKRAYMHLFRQERSLADQLMIAFESWVHGRHDDLDQDQAEFAAWVAHRKQLANATADLSANNSRNWE
jgi:tetratricopeptide (TPR) repeat protein